MPELGPAEEGGTKKEERRRIDLSVAQVAASALATVVGALLASELGVYGTIMGAAVVSVGATTGGAVLQHVFRRTGEQLRGAVDRGPYRTVNTLRQVPLAPERAAEQSAEQSGGPHAGPPVLTAEWNEPQVVRARRRWSWRTYAAVSGLVFLLAMTPIMVFELATGQPVSATVKGESGSGTSFGGTVTPRGSTRQDPPSERPSSGGGQGSQTTPSAPAPTRPGREPSATPSTTPSGGSGGSGGSASPSAGPSASPSAGSSPSAGGSGTSTGGATPQPPAPTGAPTGAPGGATVAPPPVGTPGS
ncbi:hypothetical protein ACGF07_23760 [Kitasatospora sp. NPDC048194]|uniref:hypothetical protein n=1 Tax=Kitasatospora sp. NPDC048194 TaxID=3364045 RepID=UPI003716464E